MYKDNQKICLSRIGIVAGFWRRDKVFVISKVSPARAYGKTLKEECKTSPRNLGMDYLDMYMMHWAINPLGNNPDYYENSNTSRIY
jgi:diketogulonate reductase-like aldo/keto reductase